MRDFVASMYNHQLGQFEVRIRQTWKSAALGTYNKGNIGNLQKNAVFALFDPLNPNIWKIY